MTSKSIERCSHCGIQYHWTVSGEAIDNANDVYCDRCQTAIYDALNKIPVEYIYYWVETKEIGMKEINVFLDNLREERKIKLRAQRVFPGLVNMSTGEYQRSECIWHNGINYHCMWWESKGEESLVVKKQEWIRNNADTKQITNLKEGDIVSIGVDGFHVRIEKIGDKKAYVRFKDIRQFKGPGQWIEFDKLIKIDK